MEHSRMEELLLSEEEKIRSELKAGQAIDRDRSRSVEKLGDTLKWILLRYNAQCADDRTRQAAADCVTATALEALPWLLSGTAEKETARRRVSSSAVIALLLSVICALSAALLIRRFFPVGCVLILGAVLCAATGGRLWLTEGKTSVRAGLDPDAVWRTLRRTVSTMDRKIDALCEQVSSWEKEALPSAPAAGMDEEELKLFGDLLEALYAGNGDFALRQLKKLRPYLRRRGIETQDYDAEHAELFDLLPTRLSPATQRPALLADGKLLLAGRATEQMQETQTR